MLIHALEIKGVPPRYAFYLVAMTVIHGFFGW